MKITAAGHVGAGEDPNMAVKREVEEELGITIDPVYFSIVTDPENPGEIICETKPGKKQSEAVAVIDFTRLHYHKVLTEIYTVIKGELELTIDGKKRMLKKGESVVLEPGMTHSARGNETWIKVTFTPGWTPEDHILVQEGEEVSRKENDKSPTTFKG